MKVLSANINEVGVQLIGRKMDGSYKQPLLGSENKDNLFQCDDTMLGFAEKTEEHQWWARIYTQINR